jgi:hypothetical protein
MSVEYLLNVGSADWGYLITIAAIPALLFALWGAKRAYSRPTPWRKSAYSSKTGPFSRQT